MEIIAILSLSIAIFYFILAIVFIVLLVKFVRENNRKQRLIKHLDEIEEKKEVERVREECRKWKEEQMKETL